MLGRHMVHPPQAAAERRHHQPTTLGHATDLLRSSGLSPTSNKMAIDGARELVAGVRQGFTVQHIHKRIKAGSWNNGNGMRLLPETTLLGNGRLHAGTGK